MGLPKLNLPIHICELPVSKQKLEVRPFLVNQEKSLMTSLDIENKTESIKIFKRLIQDCVITEEFDITQLNIVDFYFLVLFIRMKSAGEMIEGRLECSKCKTKTEFEINLEQSIFINNKEKNSVIVKLNDKLSIRVVPLKIESLFLDKDIDIIDFIASSIDTVIIEEKVFNDFTLKELKENILFTFTKIDLDKISKGLESLTQLSIKFNFNCINCGFKNSYETNDITNL